MVTFASTFLLLLLIGEVQLQTVVAQAAQEAVEDDEPTCSLDPSSKSDCSTADAASSATSTDDVYISNRRDLTRQVISLTDETFDDLTLTSTPATWLIMFKTDSCGICKKVKPVLDSLSVDADIVNHNDGELQAIINNGNVQTEKQHPNEPASEEDEGAPKGPVYVWEESTGGGEIPKGPVFIATIDASWSGRDTFKRFGVDATPTILVLRNEGHSDNSNVDSRSYYTYRGQRATYPFRSFVLGGYALRKRMDMPPPLADSERKPLSYWGRVYDLLLSPSARWAGGIIGKLLLAWFAFIGLLGLGMRVHNYAWGDNAEDNSHEEKEIEIEKEKAQGRREREIEKEKAQGSKDNAESAEERSTRRQKIMWEQKAKNHAKFAANQEAKEKKKEAGNEGGDDDEFDGVGFSVKKSDAQKIQKDARKAAKSVKKSDAQKQKAAKSKDK